MEIGREGGSKVHTEISIDTYTATQCVYVCIYIYIYIHYIHSVRESDVCLSFDDSSETLLPTKDR